MAVQLAKTGAATFIKKSGAYGAAAWAGYQLNDLISPADQPQSIQPVTNHFIQETNYNLAIIISLAVILLVVISFIIFFLFRKQQRQVQQPNSKSSINSDIQATTTSTQLAVNPPAAATTNFK